MRNLAILTLTLIFAAACGSKKKAADAPIVTKSPTTIGADKTKAQGKDKKAKKAAEKAEKSEAPAQAAAEPAKAETPAITADTVKCTKEKEERTLEIKPKDSGCETIYTKGGEAKSVAQSVKGKSHCQSISARIQKNLTAAGYTCQ
jgi:hypothetical protein